MDIQARKILFVQEFLRVADDQMVTKLEKLLHVERKKRLNEEVFPLTIAELNKIVDDSEKDFIEGKVSTAQALWKQIDTWK